MVQLCVFQCHLAPTNLLVRRHDHIVDSCLSDLEDDKTAMLNQELDVASCGLDSVPEFWNHRTG